MNAMDVPQMRDRRPGLALGLAVAIVALVVGLLLSPTSAAAKKVGNPVKGGKVIACYKAKGKGAGNMRALVKGKRCKRGERKLVWSVAGGAQGAPGAAGATGAPGPQGAPGQPGANGTNGSKGADGTAAVASLETKVASLTLEVQTLEQLLSGVGEGDLSDLLDKLDGITGTQLDGVVSKLSGVTGTQLNEVVATLDGITNGELNGVITKLDGLTNSDLTGALSKLSGVTGSELTGVVSKLNGVTGTQLNEIVGQLPVIGSLCTRVSGLTSGLVEVNQGVKLLTILGLPGLSLGNLTALPSSLPTTYTCPS